MKNKFNIWLNIVTICLCICAITIGIYSLKQASLNVSGSIGFVQSKVKYDVTARMKGYMTKSGDTEIFHDEFETLQVTTSANNEKSIALKEIYFNNPESEIVSDIVIELTITNNANYPIEATLGLPTNETILTNIDFTKSQNIVAQMGTTDDKGKTQTMTINMSLVGSDLTTTPVNFNFSITLDKFEQIKYDEDIGYYTTMGSHIVGSGTSQEVKPVRWLPIAKYNSEYTTENLYNYERFDNTTEPTSGSYYFISENVLDFGDGTMPTPESGSISGNAYGVAYANEVSRAWYSTKTDYTSFYAQHYLISNIRGLLQGNTVQQYASHSGSFSASSGGGGGGGSTSTSGSATPYGNNINLIKEYGLGGLTYASITARDASELFELNNLDGKKYADFKDSEKTADKLWLLSKTEANTYFVDDTSRATTTFRGAVDGSVISGGWWLRSPIQSSGQRIYVWAVNPSGSSTGSGFVPSAIGVRPAFTLTI